MLLSLTQCDSLSTAGTALARARALRVLVFDYHPPTLHNPCLQERVFYTHLSHGLEVHHPDYGKHRSSTPFSNGAVTRVSCSGNRTAPAHLYAGLTLTLINCCEHSFIPYTTVVSHFPHFLHLFWFTVLLYGYTTHIIL